jgi:hypothetical protein
MTASSSLALPGRSWKICRTRRPNASLPGPSASRQTRGLRAPGNYEARRISGALSRASTSHVERNNGTLRQGCKRLTRLTYAFSKKWENLKAALALHFRVLQLLQDPRLAEDHARDGGGDHRSRVEA